MPAAQARGTATAEDRPNPQLDDNRTSVPAATLTGKNDQRHVHEKDANALSKVRSRIALNNRITAVRTTVMAVNGAQWSIDHDQ